MRSRCFLSLSLLSDDDDDDTMVARFNPIKPGGHMSCSYSVLFCLTMVARAMGIQVVANARFFSRCCRWHVEGE